MLEEFAVGEISDLIRKAKQWWSKWFTKIREWMEEDVDNERITWLRCYGIPCKTWNYSFFEMLANMVGKFICADENTSKGVCMNVARFMVKTKCALVLNETFNVLVNDVTFRIKMTEDTHCPLRIMAENSIQKKISSSEPESEVSWSKLNVKNGEDRFSECSLNSRVRDTQLFFVPNGVDFHNQSLEKKLVFGNVVLSSI